MPVARAWRGSLLLATRCAEQAAEGPRCRCCAAAAAMARQRKLDKDKKLAGGKSQLEINQKAMNILVREGNGAVGGSRRLGWLGC